MAITLQETISKNGDYYTITVKDHPYIERIDLFSNYVDKVKALDYQVTFGFKSSLETEAERQQISRIRLNKMDELTGAGIDTYSTAEIRNNLTIKLRDPQQFGAALDEMDLSEVKEEALRLQGKAKALYEEWRTMEPVDREDRYAGRWVRPQPVGQAEKPKRRSIKRQEGSPEELKKPKPTPHKSKKSDKSGGPEL